MNVNLVCGCHKRKKGQTSSDLREFIKNFVFVYKHEKKRFEFVDLLPQLTQTQYNTQKSAHVVP